MHELTRPFHYAGFLAAGGHNRIFHWVAHFGGLGLFFVSFVDASIVPLPIPGSTDLLLIFMVARRANAYWMALMAILGSILGAYFTWDTGVRGGKATLQRHLSRRNAERVSGWVGQHGTVVVTISALLPPPIPLMPFILAAGAAGLSRGRFLTAFGLGRMVRYSLVAWAGVVYGRRLEGLWSDYLSRWGATILWSFVGVIVCGAVYGFWHLRREQKKPRPAT